jgi:signal recognition particle subunit SRP54
MTLQERRNPDILKASRKKRIAAGSGAKVEDVNKLLKQHRTMADMMKSLGGAKRGPMAQMAQMFGLGGGMPQPSPEQIAELQNKFGGGAGMGAGIPQSPPPGAFPAKPSLPGLPGLPGAKPGLPGLPGLGGLNPFGKKK